MHHPGMSTLLIEGEIYMQRFLFPNYHLTRFMFFSMVELQRVITKALGHVGRVIATTFESLEVLRERYSEIDETIAELLRLAEVFCFPIG